MKIVVFASGSGSNAEALARWALQNPSQVVVVGLLTDNPQAGVVQRAMDLKIPLKIVQKSDAKNSRKYHEQKILQAIFDWQPDWIFLAGYMRILSKSFLENFMDHASGHSRVVNIHPSLLPEFPGVDAYRRAFDAGVSHGGITVHIVDEGMDTGPILAQERFPRLPDDDLGSFQSRGQAVEHRIYVQVLAGVAEKFQNLQNKGGQ